MGEKIRAHTIRYELEPPGRWPEEVQLQEITIELERVSGEARTLAIECRGLSKKLAERRQSQAPNMVLVRDAVGQTHMVQVEEVLRVAQELEGGSGG